ncbi:hypothetical protein NW766_012732 [Fusarium irregulare]|uniref:Uncharacterized protein n=1 Tax=Fusarium irregulare TaxID=2494466 RepID=A0A9W8U4D9_9HYPO|nr:hypothetical protein NW766_012732 [Fusarium irregulare]
MIPRLKGWITQKHAKNNNTKPQREPELPFFLNSEQHLLPLCIAKIQMQDAPIFKLPADLRHEILIQAFGARRIHMDLFYNYPYVSKPGDSGLPQAAHYGGWYTKTRRKRWQWRGCVCHRTPSPEKQKLNDDVYRVWPADNRSGDPYSPYPSWELGEERNRLFDPDEPGDDTCLRGYARECRSYTDSGDRSACWIGAMGWLMACRQAKALLERLPRDIPTPPRLLLLQSLEIVWRLETVQLPDIWYTHLPARTGIAQVQLKRILIIILDSLSRLRRLHLALVVRTDGWGLYLDNTVYLLDTFAAGLCRSKNLKVPLQISMSSGIYRKLYRQAKHKANHKDIVKSYVDFQFWRYLDGTCALAPDSPDEFCKIHGATVDNGYWIVLEDKNNERERYGHLLRL